MRHTASLLNLSGEIEFHCGCFERGVNGLTYDTVLSTVNVNFITVEAVKAGGEPEESPL